MKLKRAELEGPRLEPAMAFRQITRFQAAKEAPSSAPRRTCQTRGTAVPPSAVELYLSWKFLWDPSSSEPRKHHYVPVCYLKQWATADDWRLCEHKLIPGGYGVKPRRTSPDGTGYQVDLYRIEGLPDAVAQDFEKRLMHLVDTDASRALENDKRPGEPRKGWIGFIRS